MDLSKNVGGTGLTLKRVAMIGVAGGLTIGVSDYWVDQWFSDDTDTKNQQRKRAATQAALGIGAAYVLKRWSRDAAIGAAVGGIVGASIRLWESEDMASTMEDWFGDDNATGTNSGTGSNTTTPPPNQGGAVFGERVVITSPRRRASVRA